MIELQFTDPDTGETDVIDEAETIAQLERMHPEHVGQPGYEVCSAHFRCAF